MGSFPHLGVFSYNEEKNVAGIYASIVIMQ